MPAGAAELFERSLAAGASALGSQFTHPGEVFGELGRDSSEMASAAPSMPTPEQLAAETAVAMLERALPVLNGMVYTAEAHQPSVV